MRFSYFAAIALVVTCGLTVSPLVRGEGMVPSEVLTRTFCIRAGAKSGTGFTIDVDGRQYLITARHILQQSPVPSEVFVLRGSEWIKLPFRAVVVEPAKVDIAVLALPQPISAAGPVRVGVAGRFLSQEVFFLGYPFGLTVDGRALNNGFPFPLAKHGIIAGLSFGDDPYIIDAINNPGFSGGPVMRMDSGNK